MLGAVRIVVGPVAHAIAEFILVRVEDEAFLALLQSAISHKYFESLDIFHTVFSR